MEILVRLGSLLSPSFFAILAGLSLIGAALLFVAGKHNAAESQVRGTKLSQLELTEYRGTGYLALAFGWSIVGLILSFTFSAVGASFLGRLLLIILSLLCLLFILCFLYAGGGTLLHAVTSQKGEITQFLFPFMAPIDNLIIGFGDLLTTGLFRQSPYPWIATKVGPAKEIKETPETIVFSHKEANATDKMEMLLHQRLSTYEARLTLEQIEKLEDERRIMEELSSIYS